MRQTTEGAIARARARHPAVCYVFDCLYLDGRPLVNEPIERRREWMADAIKNIGAVSDATAATTRSGSRAVKGGGLLSCRRWFC